jgi:hypothetical protein
MAARANAPAAAANKLRRRGEFFVMVFSPDVFALGFRKAAFCAALAFF